MTVIQPEPPRTGDATAVVLDLADDVVLRCVRDVHRHALHRAYALLPSAVPGVGLVAGAQEALTGGVYAAVSGGLRAGGFVARRLAARGGGGSVEATPRARVLRASVNAYRGDRLTGQADPYALPTTVRSAAGDVPLTAAALAAAFPHIRPDIVVLVHGLAETDESWRHGERSRGTTYPLDLERSGVATPVLVRYSSGRPVWENGIALAGLLDRLEAAWPMPVRRMHLVGHSMGGLVVRSAAAHGLADGMPWVARVRTLVTLGTPHLGAPLERAAHLGSRVLRVAEASRPFADLLDSRSAGIVDLRHGHTSEADHLGRDLYRQWGADAAPLAPLPHVAHHFVAAAAAPGPDTVVSRGVGDLMVPVGSATFRRSGGVHVPDAIVHRVRGTHQSLLNHPDVAAALPRWLA
ncbi:MAG: hypothetical protein L0H79_14220 [Intrasporangium sp.]|uniref:esterase/lipase family protein n=1 Tax=Intrasporangium sp. TaxID=1925024 RepID=UPI00264972C7|nr:hypothetical protein [Intrasporangium sp.]MDN5796897.1 hypothetical protein [Intrasporangium sp.]